MMEIKIREDYKSSKIKGKINLTFEIDNASCSLDKMFKSLEMW